MWVLIITVTLNMPAVTSVPGFVTLVACTSAGVEWETMAVKTLDKGTRLSWVCVKTTP